MPIDLFGNEEKSSDLQFCCKIQIDNDQYFGFVASKYYEYDIRHENQIIYRARFEDISKLNIFLHRLTLSFSNAKNDLFKISSSGIFGFGRQLQVKGHKLKVPRQFSFNLPEIGYEIEMERTQFKSNIRNKNDIGIGIGLSYFIWLEQQRWINMD